MDRSALRRVSKQLLGNAYRMELGAELDSHQGGSVSAIELSGLMGIQYARVHEELKRLELAGLLITSDVAGEGRQVAYKVADSVYWPMCAALLDEYSEVV